MCCAVTHRRDRSRAAGGVRRLWSPGARVRRRGSDAATPQSGRRATRRTGVGPHAQRFGAADARSGLVVDGGARVGSKQIAEDAQRRTRDCCAGASAAIQLLAQIDERLVEGRQRRRVRPGYRRRRTDGEPSLRSRGRLPAAGLLEPERVAEVVKRNQGQCRARATQRAYSGSGPAPWRRLAWRLPGLHSTLSRQAERRNFGHTIKVRLGVAPPIAG